MLLVAEFYEFDLVWSSLLGNGVVIAASGTVLPVPDSWVWRDVRFFFYFFLPHVSPAPGTYLPNCRPHDVSTSPATTPHPLPPPRSCRVLPPFSCFPPPYPLGSLSSLAGGCDPPSALHANPSSPPHSNPAFCSCGALPVWRCAVIIRLSVPCQPLWDVFCATPVRHTGLDVLDYCLICSHGRVQSCCCAGVVTCLGL